MAANNEIEGFDKEELELDDWGDEDDEFDELM